MLLNPKLPCPLCGAIVPNAHPLGRPYKCQQCGAELQRRHSTNAHQAYAFFGAAAVIAWLTGLRYWALVGGTIGIFLGLMAILVPVIEKLWPTQLEPYDGRWQP